MIFKAYCEKNPNASLDIQHLRDAFPGQINSYYYNRFLNHLFYNFEEEITVDVQGSKHFGVVLCRENDDWDFYWDDDHVQPNVKGEVRCVKMWRKSDFDKLLKKAHEDGIIVEPA